MVNYQKKKEEKYSRSELLFMVCTVMSFFLYRSIMWCCDRIYLVSHAIHPLHLFIIYNHNLIHLPHLLLLQQFLIFLIILYDLFFCVMLFLSLQYDVFLIDVLFSIVLSTFFLFCPSHILFFVPNHDFRARRHILPVAHEDVQRLPHFWGV